MLIRTLLSITGSFIAAALLLAPTPCRAVGAVVNVSINGETDDDVQSVTANATAVASGFPGSGTATAFGDLASGALRAKTQGAAELTIGGSLNATAFSELTDVLFLIPDQGSPVIPVPFTLFMDIGGTLGVGGLGLPSLNLQLASARGRASLEISGLMVSGVSPASFQITRLVEASGGLVQGDNTTVQLQQNTTGSFDTTFDAHLTATAMVTPNSGFNIRAFLAAESGTEAAFSSIADLYYQTAQLGVVVPAGYSLTSSSGVFLTVPEPGASAPFALAAVALLRLVRRAPRR